MKKAILFSFILLLMISVFAVGVISGLKGDEFQTLMPYSPSSESAYEEPLRALKNPRAEISSISGTETTLNGIPIRLWMGKSMESARKIKNAYCTQWAKENFLVQDTGNPKTGFAHAFDMEKRQFYGILSYDKENSSTVIPFNIDMKNSKPEDKWDDDLPRELRKEKGFHIRSSDEGMHYESLFYTEKYDPFHTLSLVRSALINAGWAQYTPDEIVMKKLPENILSFFKGKKSCIVTVEALKNNDHGHSMVAILLGNF